MVDSTTGTLERDLFARRYGSAVVVKFCSFERVDFDDAALLPAEAEEHELVHSSVHRMLCDCVSEFLGIIRPASARPPIKSANPDLLRGDAALILGEYDSARKHYQCAAKAAGEEGAGVNVAAHEGLYWSQYYLFKENRTQEMADSQAKLKTKLTRLYEKSGATLSSFIFAMRQSQIECCGFQSAARIALGLETRESLAALSLLLREAEGRGSRRQARYLTLLLSSRLLPAGRREESLLCAKSCVQSFASAGWNKILSASYSKTVALAKELHCRAVLLECCLSMLGLGSECLPIAMQRELANDLSAHSSSPATEAPPRELQVVKSASIRWPEHNSVFYSQADDDDVLIVSSLKKRGRQRALVAGEPFALELRLCNPIKCDIHISSLIVRSEIDTLPGAAECEPVAVKLSAEARAQSLCVVIVPRQCGRLIAHGIEFVMFGLAFSSRLLAVDAAVVAPMPLLVPLGDPIPHGALHLIDSQMYLPSLCADLGDVELISSLSWRIDRLFRSHLSILSTLARPKGLFGDSSTRPTAPKERPECTYNCRRAVECTPTTTLHVTTYE